VGPPGGLNRLLRRLAGICLLVALVGVAGGGVWAYHHYTSPGPLPAETTVLIRPGTNSGDIARQLAAAGIISRPTIFQIGVRLEGAGGALRAGEYAFPPRVSPRQVTEILKAGKTIVRRITVPEGLTSKQIVALLDTIPGLEGDTPAPPPEGTLLPETYHFSYGDQRKDLVARMSAAMDAAVAELWATRAEDLPFDSIHEAMTLASIVEKESALPHERPRIAGVFVNRLRIGMPLQADPTVIYAVTDGEGVLPRPLTRTDLQSPSPYNTYVTGGLPPGPIANPGRSAIAAALNPADTDALFFVADGSGGHAFARTLEDHNRNVARWRRLEARRQSEAAREGASEQKTTE
jgi:UPF0755 protein